MNEPTFAGHGPASLLLAGHGPALAIVLPLLAGALLIVLERAGLRRAWAARAVPIVSFAATAAGLVVAALLFAQAASGTVQAYLVGNWAAPFGIALALDRLSALLVLVTAVVACGALLYALGGDARRGVAGHRHFHALFQFQLMGLHGAFLTADLFNLFVFFEVLLAASYGLLLHGAGRARVKASVHYVVFNLAGSALFLVAVSLLFGLTGTLNMADLAVKLPALPAGDARLAQAAALLLLVVFAVKAALLPLYFWLPDTYSGASAPVAALFAVMTKVGVYSIARVTTLLFGAGSGAIAGVADPFLPVLAGATLVLAAVGALAAARLSGLVAYLVVASAGTLLLAVGLGRAGTIAAALFYLVNSTFVAAAWFLVADRVAHARGGSDRLEGALPLARAAWAPLGIAFFVGAVAIAGVPPLSGFFGKALLLQAAGTGPGAAAVVAVVLGSSLALMVALARAGAVLFWQGGPAPHPAPRVAAPPTESLAPHPLHPAAITALLAAAVATAVFAGPLSRYTTAAAAQLLDRRDYIAAVLGARPVPPAHDIRREMRERGELK
jgi:multicomponent K+:H+ antiporter subunit D